MTFLKPNDSVPSNISLYRWQRDWIRNHHAINLSGLVQEMIIKLIEERDPEYLKKINNKK